MNDFKAIQKINKFWLMAKYFHEGRGWEKFRVQIKMQRILKACCLRILSSVKKNELRNMAAVKEISVPNFVLHSPNVI